MDQDGKPAGHLVDVRIQEFYLLLWRLLFRADSTLPDLQRLLQIAFGWTTKRKAN